MQVVSAYRNEGVSSQGSIYYTIYMGPLRAEAFFSHKGPLILSKQETILFIINYKMYIYNLQMNRPHGVR